MAPADGGMEASRRMHEYLLSKQRKQEEFWLRKYGKVLQVPPPSVGKPAANPRLPPLGGGAGSAAGSSRGSNYGTGGGGSAGGSSSGLLPPLPGPPQGGALPAASSPAGGLPPHHHRQPKGHAPIFQASEPVKDFFSRNARPPRGGAAAASRDEFGNVLPPVHRPPEPYRRAPPAQLPPMAAGYAQQQLHQRMSGSVVVEQPFGEQQHQHHRQHQHQQQQQIMYPQPQQQQQQQAQDYGGLEAADSPQQPFLSPSPRAGGYGLSPRGGSGGKILATGGAHSHGLPPLPPEPSSSSARTGPKPLRNLEMELAVIRAIKSREDVLERLRVAAGKLDTSFGGSAPVVLSPVDPLVRLFYRLVGGLRQRTLDAVEAVAAWRRKVNPSEPFVYFGVDYLAAIGPDVGFLDELAFLRTRLTFGRAADDPFLAEVTPDGIPIEEATTCDLRRGGQRFSSEALRIRMARKVLAHYCGRPMPGANPSTYSALDGGPSAATSVGGSGGGLASEPSGPLRSVRSTASVPASTGGAWAAEEGEEEELQGGGGMTALQILRALSPPVAALQSQPPAVRAITPPAATMAPPPPEDVDAQEENREEEEEEARAGRSVLLVESSEAQEEMPEAEAEAAQESVAGAEEPEADTEARAGAKAAAGAAPGPDDLEVLPEPEPEPEPEEEQEAAAHLATASAGAAAAAAAGEPAAAKEEEDWEQQQRPAPQVVSGPEPERPEEPQQAQQPVADPPQQLQESVPRQQQPAAVVELLEFEDDNDYIDFALGAILHSLEPEFVHSVPPGGFTVAGWEIDRQLDEVVRGIASPELTAGRAKAYYSSGAGAAPALPRGSSGRIPQPPVEPKPPASRGRSSDTGLMTTAAAAKPPSSRGSCIPTPPTALRKPSGGSAAAAPATAMEPPVRVHLEPRSNGVDMGLSMDAEDMAAAVPAMRPGSTGRPMSRPGSHGGGIGGDVGAGAFSSYTEALPAINEDRSAFFGVGYGDAAASAADEYGGITGSRPPLRVHLRPHSREISLTFSMDDDGILMASPAAAAAATPVVASSALELEGASMTPYNDAAASTPPLPRLEDSPLPFQGSLSGRANRNSLRLSRQSGGGSRPVSATQLSTPE